MAGLPERDEWAGRNKEEDDRQQRVEQTLKNEAKRIRFFGAQPEPGLDNPYARTVRAERPAEQFMEALDSGRVQPAARSLPGLGPTAAELAAQRRYDAEQARHISDRRETDHTPIVAAPERMSDDRNARLFPTGPGNDDDRGR